MKTKIVNLIFCLAGGISLIFVLYSLSNYKNSVSGGFLRKLPSHKVAGIISVDVQYSSWYIAGITHGKLYLGNRVGPALMLEVDLHTKDTTYRKLSVPDTCDVYKGAFIAVDSSHVYMFDGIKPGILIGDIDDLKMKKFKRTPYFTAAAAISESKFVIRSTNNKMESILLKLMPDSTKAVYQSNLLQKQVDGMFCTDGILYKVPNSSKILYAYYYRNQFICADTNLNLQYKGFTIDTISKANVQIDSTTSGRLKLANVPILVNKRICANTHWIFIHSARIASNESSSVVENAAIIDVYRIEDGKYAFSFYLPNFKNKKITDFKVYGDILVALYGEYLYFYQLNF